MRQVAEPSAGDPALSRDHGGVVNVARLADALGRKAAGGHWNAGIAVLRQNRLIDQIGKGAEARFRVTELLRKGRA